MNSGSKEFERRFLVNDYFNQLNLSDYKASNITQCYLSVYPAIRVRKVSMLYDEYYMTIKGLENDEFEDRIDAYRYERLSKLSESLNLDPIEKIRYNIGRFEVDIFQNKNKGLIIAEIELSNMSEEFEKPQWLGEEITNVIKYKNSVLAQYPKETWR